MNPLGRNMLPPLQSRRHSPFSVPEVWSTSSFVAFMRTHSPWRSSILVKSHMLESKLHIAVIAQTEHAHSIQWMNSLRLECNIFWHYTNFRREFWLRTIFLADPFAYCYVINGNKSFAASFSMASEYQLQTCKMLSFKLSYCKRCKCIRSYYTCLLHTVQVDVYLGFYPLWILGPSASPN